MVHSRRLEMKRFELQLLGVLVVSLVAFTARPVTAGGLIDTGPEVFLAETFSNPADISNPWWTLPADHNFLYFAEDGDDCVWNLVEIDKDSTGPAFFGDYAGTDAAISLDREWVDEDCVYGDDFQTFMASGPDAEEVTYDWYAQDDDQNIWYMGEDTYSDGDRSGSFAAGCDGAEAGIVVLGNPSKGDFQRQEFYADEAEDWAKVLTFKQSDDLVCMKTKEWTPLETGEIEHKWYCSDGTTGVLSPIEELSGKTLIVELVDTDVTPPSDAGLPISPVPSCPNP
jgi:hypothetical protein